MKKPDILEKVHEAIEGLSLADKMETIGLLIGETLIERAKETERTVTGRDIDEACDIIRSHILGLPSDYTEKCIRQARRAIREGAGLCRDELN